MRTTALKMYREDILKITQTKMAELLGLTPNNYNMIENGKRGISLDLIKKVSVLVNKSMDEVYFDLKSHKTTTSEQTATKEAI